MSDSDRVRLTISIPRSVHNKVSEAASRLGISKNAVITLLLSAAIATKDEAFIQNAFSSPVSNDFTNKMS